MFEKIALDAVEMLAVLFWIAIAFIVVWGTLYMRSIRKA